MDRYDFEAISKRCVGLLEIPTGERFPRDPFAAADYEPEALRLLRQLLDEGKLWFTTAERWDAYKKRVGKAAVETVGGSANERDNHYNRMEPMVRIEVETRKYGVIFDDQGRGRALDREQLLAAFERGEAPVVVEAHRLIAHAAEGVGDRCESGPEGFVRLEDGSVRAYGVATALLKRLLEPAAAGLV